MAAPALMPRLAHAAGRDEIWRLDATAQAALVRNREVSALELVDAAIDRIEALNPLLNAVVADTFERAREAARGLLAEGPFAGVPYLVKDLDDLAGVPTSQGSRLFADNVPTTTTPYVARALSSGGARQELRNSACSAPPSRLRSERVAIRGIPTIRPAAPRAVPPPPWQRVSCPSPTRPTAGARSAFPPRAAACSG